jgi:hypothetical protein
MAEAAAVKSSRRQAAPEVFFFPLLALAALAVVIRPEVARGRLGLVIGAGAVVTGAAISS